MTYKQGINFRLNKTYVTAYDGEDDPTPGTDPVVADPKPGEPKKVFTQEEIDKIVQSRLEREKKTQQELLTKLTDLEKRSNLSDEERSKLQKRIAELQNENMSVEEKLNREVKTWSEKYQTETETLKKQVSEWQTRHHSYQIERELMDAAQANDARVPFQLVDLLKQNTKMKEAVDEKGNPTGRYEVKVTITDQKEDGTPFTLELSPMEAVAKLREMPEKWGNQFNAKGIDGTGNRPDILNPSVNSNYNGLVLNKGYEEYKKSRESAMGKAQLGLDKFKR